MKKIIGIFTIVTVMLPFVSADAAVQIKKAAPVATKEAASTSTSTSLVPSVLGLVTGVMAINQQQKALTDACIPSKSEMKFVDDTIKEWAKTGTESTESIKKLSALSDRTGCPSADDGYATSAEQSAAAGADKPCYNYFSGPGNEHMVWEGFPKTGIATYDKNGKKVTVTDTYDLFAMIDFGPSDYKASEVTMAAKLLNKVENCSNAKLNAKKKELWGNFLIQSASGVGQKTNTGSIMEQIGTITGGSSLGGAASLTGIAAQYMAK